MNERGPAAGEPSAPTPVGVAYRDVTAAMGNDLGEPEVRHEPLAPTRLSRTATGALAPQAVRMLAECGGRRELGSGAAWLVPAVMFFKMCETNS